MQTILGANGAIGTELAKSLTSYTKDIRLVSRNPKKVNEKDILHSADLTKREDVFKALKGSEVVYLTVGFNYDIKVWRAVWPPLMKNVLDACEEYGSKLVFFDNIYAIGKEHIHHITEDCPISPCSKKGEVRAEVDRLVLNAMDKGKVPSIIARSGDFFSTMRATSMLMIMVYDNLIKGKKAQWFCNAKAKHSMTYCPDAAKGTAMLGNTPTAFNQIWNLPTDKNALTGEEWVKLFATVMGTTDKYQVLPGWGIKALGIFMPIMKELHEMSYQFASDYFFDSAKFEKFFNYTTTSNEDAVRETVAALKNIKE
ncbi:MAG: NAD-dependent epimerase/dehydratase family protein [Imperialibacter sp.]|uniref:NAD-dependent epimerase/dehydratase family protein n=1 Tax=Imperialibacter sp. TaxID=2038411 RepID=UPI0032EC3D33